MCVCLRAYENVCISVSVCAFIRVCINAHVSLLCLSVCLSVKSAGLSLGLSLPLLCLGRELLGSTSNPPRVDAGLLWFQPSTSAVTRRQGLGLGGEPLLEISGNF